MVVTAFRTVDRALGVRSYPLHCCFLCYGRSLVAGSEVSVDPLDQGWLCAAMQFIFQTPVTCTLI